MKSLQKTRSGQVVRLQDAIGDAQPCLLKTRLQYFHFFRYLHFWQQSFAKRFCEEIVLAGDGLYIGNECLKKCDGTKPLMEKLHRCMQRRKVLGDSLQFSCFGRVGDMRSSYKNIQTLLIRLHLDLGFADACKADMVCYEFPILICGENEHRNAKVVE